jgi:hypothetical protein
MLFWSLPLSVKVEKYYHFQGISNMCYFGYAPCLPKIDVVVSEGLRTAKCRVAKKSRDM